ncbi:MAG: hypothetical protein IJ565_02610 [Bacilli bacterium]|nr:hypothetical protein [Bacilli bacterium]
MKKLTVRLDDYVYDRLNLVSNEEKISVNKIVASILKKFIDQPKEINYLNEIDKKLNDIIYKLEHISKKQTIHYKISSQHFANHGYLSNADISEDKCLKELLSRKDNFNE